VTEVDDPTTTFRLDGKVAIVTGASSGFGTRFARVLSAAGAQVVLTARRAERLRDLADELANVFAVPADLADPGAPAAIVDATIARYGHVDVLVNNAGATYEAAALDLPVDELRRVLEVNLVAPFALAQASARAMVERGTGGSIVNVASQFGLVGVNAGLSPYVASKGGLVNLTRQLAIEWARRGVRVNALAPGYFRTEMTAEMLADDKSRAWVRRMTALGREGDEHELDGALLFLASAASSYVTGAVLSVDGGWTAA
jgi:NAD(P)-dependent dehydrogenase (short-subunit alcohol dehydrogenase family)